MIALDEEKGGCPAKAKAIYIDGVNSPPTAAMRRGLFFETLFYGATDTGEIVTMQRTSKGAKSEAELRVEWHVRNLKEKVAVEMSMDFHKPREVIIAKLSDRYDFVAALDMVSSMRMADGSLAPEAIIDFKTSESILSTYGDYAWGAPASMDHLQAYAYTWAYKAKYGRHVPFFYYVMDVSPKKGYKFVGGKVDGAGLAEFKERVRKTVATIEHYEAIGEWPEIPSYENCGNCPLKSICKSYRQGAMIQTIWG